MHKVEEVRLLVGYFKKGGVVLRFPPGERVLPDSLTEWNELRKAKNAGEAQAARDARLKRVGLK